MIIIKPSYNIIEQKYDGDLIVGMLKHIELCGRNCYRSSDKITDTSYIGFIDRLMKAGHGAMLEHGTIYLTIPIGSPVIDPEYMMKMDIVAFFSKNKYSYVRSGDETYYITTNLRVVYDNNDFKIIDFYDNFKSNKTPLSESIFKWMTPPSDEHVKRHTVEFIYHIAASRDVNRHRPQSVAEESTRYCNYSKDKFSDGPGAHLNIMEPVWFSDLAKKRINSEDQWSLRTMCRLIAQGRENEMDAIDMWRFVNLACEFGYKYNTQQFGWTAQQASLMLPLDTKTCSIHTVSDIEWCHFFNLRALGTTGNPRPSVKEVAWPLMQEFIEKKYITVEQINTERYNEILSNYPNIEEYIKK